MAKKQFEDNLINDLTESFLKKSSNARASYLWQSSTDVKDWVSTGSYMLDLVLSNKKDGGVPVGRLIEISGGEGAGKTLLGSYILASTQKKGGVAILIDSEHAASMDVLKASGVDVSKLVYIQANTVEDVFQAMETIVNKIKNNEKNPLITIVWDSVAATSTRAEIEGNYGDQTIAMAARFISQGLRKYIPVCSKHNVCLVFINQLRTKIGMSFGDNLMTPGGKAIPYHASIRLRLNHFKQIKDKNGDLIGRIIKCEVKKNKVAPPMRTMYYTIRWGDKPGAWVDDSETLWDSAIRSEVLKKVTAQKYMMISPSTKKEIELTRRTFNNLVETDENFLNDLKTLLSEKYIITSKNILEEDVVIEEASSEEGLE